MAESDRAAVRRLGEAFTVYGRRVPSGDLLREGQWLVRTANDPAEIAEPLTAGVRAALCVLDWPAAAEAPPSEARVTVSRKQLARAAADRLAAWSEVVANGGNPDRRSTVRHAATTAAEAVASADEWWVAQASALLLGVEPPLQTERERLLDLAATALQQSPSSPAVQRIVAAGWLPPNEGEPRG